MKETIVPNLEEKSRLTADLRYALVVTCTYGMLLLVKRRVFSQSYKKS